MTRDYIIQKASEAGLTGENSSFAPISGFSLRFGLERFAKLIAADERRKHQADIEQWKAAAAKAEHWRAMALSRDGDGRTVQQIQAEAAAAEREACARLVYETGEWHGEGWRSTLCMKTKSAISASIRARGNP